MPLPRCGVYLETDGLAHGVEESLHNGRTPGRPGPTIRLARVGPLDPWRLLWLAGNSWHLRVYSSSFSLSLPKHTEQCAAAPNHRHAVSISCAVRCSEQSAICCVGAQHPDEGPPARVFPRGPAQGRQDDRHLPSRRPGIRRQRQLGN